MAGEKSLTGVLAFLPFVAAIYAIYEAYGSRGIGGFVSDLKALPGLMKNPEALKQVAMGVVILVAGSYLITALLPKSGRYGFVKHLGYAGVYYLGIQQIALAIRSGAGRYTGTRPELISMARRR